MKASNTREHNKLTRRQADQTRRNARLGRAASLGRLLKKNGRRGREFHSILILGNKSPQALNHPEWLQVRLPDGKLSWGPDQSWMPAKKQQRRGCSVTAASLLCAYLARKNAMVSLFRPYRLAWRRLGSVRSDHIYTREEMLEQMEDLWSCLNPGIFGVPRLTPMEEALDRFFQQRGQSLTATCFHVSPFRARSQKQFDELVEFVQSRLLYDIPVLMLILDRGKQTVVQSAHWVTIIGCKCRESDHHVIATIIDHGEWKELDLDGWYHHSIFGGGFVSCRTRQLEHEEAERVIDLT